MSRRPQGQWVPLCVFACIVLGIGVLHAATPESEYRQLIRVNQDIQPLGEHPFGERISLADGSLSFTQTDISLSGNGPVLQLVRQFQGEASYAQDIFADWDMAVPHLETETIGAPPSETNPQGLAMWNYNSVAGHVQRILGWEIDNLRTDPFADLNTRCTNFTVPPTVVRYMGDPDLEPWEPMEWWKGYHLVLPGDGSQDMLVNPDSAAKSTYPAVTKSHWRFSCLPSTANGQPGEGFLGESPDGTKYWFDELVYRSPDTMMRALDGSTASVERQPRTRLALVDKTIETLISVLTGSGIAHAAPLNDAIYRSLGVLLVTKIQDRFGNTLVYKYDADGYLTGINASDGRSLTLTYVAGTQRVQYATLQPASGAPRVWTYTYDNTGALVAVMLPDGSQWHYDLSPIRMFSMQGDTTGSSCLKLTVPYNLNPVTATVTHPSGLTGAFSVKPVKHWRSYGPLACLNHHGDYSSPDSYVAIPHAWWSLSVTRQTLSGAGMPIRTWTYGYSQAPDSWVDCSTVGCSGTVYTDVTSPDESSIRYTFSNRYDYTEGQLLRTDYYAGSVGASTLLRSEVNHYAPPTTAPLPSSAGGILEADVNYDQISKYSPLDKRTITQDGDTYVWQAEAFNSYAQVVQQKRSNSISTLGVEESLGYLNDTNLWVLGLPTTITNLTEGEVVDKNVYDPTHDTLAERWHFGQKLMSYSFNAQGQLASFTDGNGNTTALGSYKRGIPQAISYPDGTHQSLVVDDLGQIQSITDQVGATTSYDYDSVGRLTRVAYPSGDEQAWYPKTFSYAFVTGAERGVGANHWRRTIAKGNQRQVTYFNAELQPVLSDTYINGDASSHTSVRSDYGFRGQTAFASYPAAGSLDLNAITAGTTSHYDGLGRLAKTEETAEGGLLVTSISYLSGARKQVTDPRGKVTTTSYQVFDEPSYDAVTKVAAPTGLTQTIVRDLYGNPTSITQGGPYGSGTVSLTKTLVYDSHHRLCRTIEPESNSEVMDYDGANNLAWSAAGLSLPAPTSGTEADCYRANVAEAGKTKRTYDAMNRLQTLTPPTGSQVSAYAYDSVGNVKSAVSGISTWSATRNKLGQLTGETLQLTGQEPWHVGYAHDAYGNSKTLTYPDGMAVVYAPDPLGRATQVGSYANGVSYFPNGEVQSFTFGNGTLYSAEQNERQHLVNFTYGHGNTLDISEDLTYDPDGNITSITDLVDGRRTKSFAYDDLNRLTSATAGGLWGTETYAYDPLNNIRTRVGNGATFTYNYDPTNRLASITGAGSSSFSYDNRGNVTRRNGSTLEFDQKNQLTQIDGLASYAYDAAGRRVVKAPVAGSPTYYFYNQSGQLLYQVEPAANTATDFVYLGRKLIAKNARDTRILLPSQVDVTLQLAAGPTLSADAQQISATVEISNRGTATLTSSAPYPVNLGGHLVDATGNIVVRDLARAAIPDIPPGASATVTIAAPASGALGTGNRLQYLPVQEGVAWFDSFGTSPLTLAALAIPAAPAMSGSGSYSVSWTGIDGATSYMLQEQVDGGSWTTVQTGTAQSWTAAGKSDGTYIYRLQVCGGVGCGPWSITATTTVIHPPAGAPGLSTPASSNNGSYTVSWTAVGTATSYALQEQANGGGWITLQSTSAMSRAISGKGNGTYGYRVQACNVGGCGPWSATRATVVTHPPASAPVVSVPASSISGSYTASWTAVSTATSYNLQEQVNGGSWATIQASGAVSRAISGKGNGTYGYRVQACNAGGCSGWSAVDSVSVLHVPAVPSGLSVTIYGSYETDTRPARMFYFLVASWSTSSTATKYDFQYCTGSTCTALSTTSTSAGVNPINGTSYTTNVRACNASGCSAWSPAVTPSVVSQ